MHVCEAVAAGGDGQRSCAKSIGGSAISSALSVGFAGSAAAFNAYAPALLVILTSLAMAIITRPNGRALPAITKPIPTLFIFCACALGNVYRPGLIGTSIGDGFVKREGEAIFGGALARLFKLALFPWGAGFGTLLGAGHWSWGQLWRRQNRFNGKSRV